MKVLIDRLLSEAGIGRETPPDANTWLNFLRRIEESSGSVRPKDPVLTSAAEMQALAAASSGEGTDQLHNTRAVLDATLDALADGVLVVDHETRGVSLFNRAFVEMWKIPPETVATKDDQRLLGSVVALLADPGESRGTD